MTAKIATMKFSTSTWMGVSAMPSLMLKMDRREEQQDQRDQLAHLEREVVGDLLVDRAAKAHRVHQGREVVVREDQLGGLLGDLGAGAHGHADVGLLDGGGVVDGVAGHGDNLAPVLEALHQAQLVLRGNPAKDRQFVEPGVDLVVGQCGELDAAEALAFQAQLLADCRGGDHVVAGDHADRDAGGLGLLDGELGLESQGVDDADDAHEAEVLDGGHRVGEDRLLVCGSMAMIARARVRRPWAERYSISVVTSSARPAIGTRVVRQ